MIKSSRKCLRYVAPLYFAIHSRASAKELKILGAEWSPKENTVSIYRAPFHVVLGDVKNVYHDYCHP